MKNLVDFSGIQISLASADTIKSWSHGEVTKPETINYRTLKPEKDGLFCEKIFGPTKDWECYCGKYKRIRYRGIICDKCGVEVTQSRVRRERMGHINLSAPVAHVWFFKGAPSKLSLILDISPRNLSNIIYFAQYVVLSVDRDKRIEILNKLEGKLEATVEDLKSKAKNDVELEKENLKLALKVIKEQIKNKEQQELKMSEATVKSKHAIQKIKDRLTSEMENGETVFKTVKDMVKKLKVKSILTEDEYLKLWEYEASEHIEVGMGAEALVALIKKIDVEKLTEKLREESRTSVGAKHVKATKRLRVVEGIKSAGIRPEWMVMKTLPVIPPDLRPMVQLSGGRFASSDLNDLYRRVINRNNRLKHLIELGAPEIILRNEKRMLQEAVDSLIDSSQSRTTTRKRRRELRSLSEMLRGKQGRFRQNLLGKRVDYSGRSVIVVGPELKLNQCGLPKDMALEMFKPFVLRELIKLGTAPNVKSAKNVIENRDPEVYDILEKVIKNHPVLLNRAPTLHKLGIQAFFPVLIEGNAISIHPCVCAGYNADFDGDQMAVHVPLSLDSREESKRLMLAQNNLLKPADGSPITVPNKEMALGCYYMTSIDERLTKANTIFSHPLEAEAALEAGKIELRQAAKIRITNEKGEREIIDTTVGRIKFNNILPEKLRFINHEINAAAIKELIKEAIKHLSSSETADLIDNIKNFGFAGATISGLSVAVSDNKMIDEKAGMITEANKKAEAIQENYRQGLITEEEKRRLTNEVWIDTTEEIADRTWAQFSPENAVKIMINSGGTRASRDQVKQLSAMRGLVVDPLGKIVELPTKSNFREGLSIFEYVTSTRGSRKGLTDSALKTADAGYLTRRLVDVAHDAIIRLEDCGTKEFIEIIRAGKREKSFINRITGRVTAKAVVDPKTKKTLAKKGEIVDEILAKTIDKSGVEVVSVRSPLTCEARQGMCAQCYGWDFSTKALVELGSPVGVVAAQSVGEPGTQLTMRVKHAGGIVGLDVTQGLPRVDELFEIRSPKNLAPLSEVAGKVAVEETPAGYEITINPTNKAEEEKVYSVPLTSVLQVATGDLVGVGAQLSSGSLNVKEITKIRGIKAAEEYLLDEIQAVYESQGIPINDKHFEVVIGKMSDKVKIEASGDTGLLPGEIISRSSFDAQNQKSVSQKGDEATAQQIILGVSQASLHTDSWLSAASFQETTNILTDAALRGQIDNLKGLKENVIIGRLIPTTPERAKIKA